ncbi:cytochrome C oxidase subunit IV family protein [Roseicyclus sp. F158]|uniref:Cytochrome bo(3) ubiquinol oxidase subunit 4 n=1 Tax=Tropicimonas omnivorans TaxID=3075590 RepID=A0ABU3DIP4_9RHOB|nr:cytochrome C oxidase subunit IV family protein [Roseicyclus sp. F158]MDT0683591.1 cytochrome C oxidase subunit IV family protein [Roseicyclus sp. F158]
MKRIHAIHLAGYAASLALTLAAFGIAKFGWLDGALALVAIGLAGLVQAAIHLRAFLHLDFKGSQREDLQLLLFAAVLIAIMVGGSLWIMFDLGHRMM